jgi:hypothetical protein
MTALAEVQEGLTREVRLLDRRVDIQSSRLYADLKSRRPWPV